MAQIDEIAPDLFRISAFAPQFNLQFNHFLVRDDEPLLFHTGMRRMFPEVRDAVARLIDSRGRRSRCRGGAAPARPPVPSLQDGPAHRRSLSSETRRGGRPGC